MYLGLEPLSASYLTDYFSGNNTTVAFTLSRAPVSASSVIITISGVKQAASTYGVSGTTLTFSAAPPSGTNNIEVLHLGVQPDTVVQPSYRTITEFTATAGQTTFSPASYTAGYIDVYRNGVKLGTADYTATNGTSVVLANACALGDLVRCEGFLITTFNNAIPNTNGAVGDSLIAGVSASKVSGALTVANMPTGSVLQIVSSTYGTTTSSTSTSYVTTGLSASITPSSASSKILIIANTTAQSTTLTDTLTTIFRGTVSGTNLAGSGQAMSTKYTNQASEPSSVSNVWLDSPSTTSSTTYTFAFRSSVSGQLSYVQAANTWGSIILMEIAG